MSTFKQYLAESKKVYNYKIKIAGEVPKNINELMKTALSKFECANISKAKRTPITESPLDFPDQKHTHVNIFDVSCSYPGSSAEIAAHLAEKLNITQACIRVRTEFEDAERDMNLAAYNRIGTKSDALLNKPYESVDAQSLVGEKQKLSFLKELGKVHHTLHQYTGVNDQLLAKSAPTGSPEKKGR